MLIATTYRGATITRFSVEGYGGCVEGVDLVETHGLRQMLHDFEAEALGGEDFNTEL